MKKFYITTPIYYANSYPHVGSAYTTISADVIARWHRLKGERVFFLTGIDEHGKKVEDAAKNANKNTKEFVNEVVKGFINCWKTLNISNDDFIRTTEKRHKAFVKDFIKKVDKNKDVYKGFYEDWYCTPCESYWTETQLVNGKCPTCGRDVEKLKEETYFFRLGKYQKELLDLYNKNPEFISPEYRKQEIINRVKEGLKDLSITRTTFKWGIEFPLDKKHITYVWFDALNNYLSAIKNKKQFWPADIHLMGKEILWFHSVIWPAMLMSAKYSLPKKIFAHGWLTINGQKMSKSLGNIIDPVYLVNKYTADSVRYFLIREIPFGQDGDFSEIALVNRINGELANELGNLVRRVIVMIDIYQKGKIKKSKVDNELAKELNLKKIDEHMEKLELHLALNEIWDFLKAVNKYVNDKKPWELKGKELEFVLYNLADSLRIIAILISSFMPTTAEKINKQLCIKSGLLKDCKFGLLKEGKIKKGAILFKKI